MTYTYERIKKISQSQRAPRNLAPSSDIIEETALQVTSGEGTEVFTITADGWAGRWSGPDASNLYVSSPTYPPAGYQEITGATSPTIAVRKRYIRQSDSSHTYQIVVGLLRFDTSNLPDTALVTGATLRLHGGMEYNTDGRSLTIEYASWTAPRGANADWTAAIGTSAHPGVLLSELPYPVGSWFEIPLQNVVSGISKTGSTSLRLHISGGAPGNFGISSGFNDVIFKGMDYQGSSPGNPDYAPRLTVSYI